jgi:hypothetical protein
VRSADSEAWFTCAVTLGNINVMQLAVGKTHEAFNDEGTLKDAKLHVGVEGLGLSSFSSYRK